ncbi:hypothetical protein [Acidisoma sp. 7E03]
MKIVQARCLLDLGQTPASFHAYAIPLDIEIRPGDQVLLHDAPGGIAFNEQMVRECRMTVRRAGPLRRAWTKAVEIFALTELYEVGFDAGGAQ